MSYFSYKISKTFEEFSVHKEEGLSSIEVEKRQLEYGKNTFPHTGAKTSRFGILLSQFRSALMIILIGAGVISGLLHEYIDMAVILITAGFNVVIGFIQENKADQALKKLRGMVSYKTLVIRDGKKMYIDTKGLVPGDVLLLEAGDKIQADARLFSVINLEVNESSLTGESESIKKQTKKLLENIPLGDRTNMVYRGTVVTSGRGMAIVTAIGASTEIGKIATLVQETTDDKTPLQIQLSNMSRVISYIVLAISVSIIIIGILSGFEDLVVLFETAVAVAVAAIPEGLVISLTVILAIGMRFILGRKALVRKLVAAETLGSVSVICTDKTGTITEGNMAVTQFVTLDHDEEMAELTAMSEKKREAYDDVIFALKIGLIANDGVLENPEAHHKDWKLIGDTTDTAVLMAGMDLGNAKHKLDEVLTHIAEFPFTSELKYMAALTAEGDGFMLSVKGAPEVMLERSKSIFTKGKAVSLTASRKKQIADKLATLSEAGLRVIAVAYKKAEKKTTIVDEDIHGLTFVSLIALADPLRSDVKETLELAKKAGIKTSMITGDHKKTAGSIARSIGLSYKKDSIFEGKQLESMTDQQLEEAVKSVSVFARVDPIHKIRIVRALQKNGEVVAMTGDGVNDAPAIKGADIGVALGSGTDVAKETSDMVLLDDSFSTIVAAVEEGRTIYQNIKKVVLYLLSGSFAEVALVTGSIVAGFPIAALPAQILWINLVEDAFPTMALAFDKGDKENMNVPPRKRKESILDKEMKFMIVAKSILESVLLFGIFVYFWTTTGDIALTRTLVFVGFGIDALFYIFSIRSLRHYVWQMSLFDNKYLIAAVLFGWAMLISAVYASPLQYLLRTVPLELWHWILMIGFGVATMAIIEIIKAIFIHKKPLNV